jgi:hypothetical protein
MLSFDNHDVDIIRKILDYSEIRELIFPAKVYLSPETSWIMTSVEQLNEVFTRRQAQEPQIVVMTFFCLSGLEVSFTLYFTKTTLPNVFGIKFTSDHVNNNLINPKTLGMIIEQAIEGFYLDHATIYDEAIIQSLPYLKQFKGPKGRKYPLELGWLTYFGSELVDLIGRDRFERLQSYDIFPHTSGGLTLVYKRELSLFKQDEDFQANELAAITQLGLASLLK